MLLLIVILIFIALAVLLVWYLIINDEHGRKKPIGSFWLAAGFGIIGIVAAILLEDHLIPLKYFNGLSQPLLPLFIVTLGVGLIEESCKFLPLTFFLYKKPYFNEHMDGILYYALAGLAFGIPENILYTLSFGVKAGIFRLFLTPIFHAATGSIVGYFVVKSKIDHSSLVKPVLAFVGAILIHGFYDFGLTSGRPILVVMSILITLITSSMLFILFKKAKDLDRAEGLIAVGNNSFCRSCGYPNPNHNLYCSSCGNYA